MPVLKVEMKQSVGSAGSTEKSRFARQSSMFFVLETMHSRGAAQIQRGRIHSCSVYTKQLL